MATLTAEAKLYNSIRLLCVDKNITANLTATFTTGNYNQPNNEFIISAGILPFKILRTAAGIESISGVSLTDERYATYGGGNKVGVLNPAQPWTATASLSCKFPTYVRFDLEALGVPEGTNLVLQMEEGFVIEGDYPGTENKPLSKVSNLLSFRTPKKFAVYPSASASVSLPLISRIRAFAGGIFSLFSPAVITNANFAGMIELESFANLTSTANFANALSGCNMVSRFGPTGAGGLPEFNFPFRARLFDSTFETSVFTLPDIPDGRIRLSSSTMINAINFSIEDILFKNFVCDMTVQSTVTAEPVKTVRTITTEPITASLTAQAEKFAEASANMSMVATIEQNHDAVIVFYGNFLQFAPFIEAFYEGQTSLSATIFWGDGTTYEYVDSYTGSNISHTWPSTQEWTIRIRSNQQQIKGLWNATGGGYPLLNGLRRVKTFGQLGLTSINQMFRSCQQVVEVPETLPSTITKMHQTFDGWTGGFAWATKDHTILGNRMQNWDVSNVQDFSSCFRGGSDATYNYAEIDFRLWNTQSATNMDRMFYQTKVNQDLSGWCVPLLGSGPSIFAGGTNNDPPGFIPPVWGTCP